MKKFLLILTTIILTLSLCSCSFGDKVSVVLSKFVPSIAEDMISEFCKNLTPPSAPLAKTSFDVRESTLVCRFDYTRNLTASEIEKIKADTENLPAVLFEMMIAMQEKCSVIENYIYEYYDISGALFHSIEASEEEYLTAIEKVSALVNELEKTYTEDELAAIDFESRGSAIVAKFTLSSIVNATDEEIENLKSKLNSKNKYTNAQSYMSWRIDTPELRAFISEFYDLEGNFLFETKTGADSPADLVEAYAAFLNEDYPDEDYKYVSSGRTLYYSAVLPDNVTKEALNAYASTFDNVSHAKETEEWLSSLHKICPEIDSYVEEVLYKDGETAYSLSVGFSMCYNNPEVAEYCASNAKYVNENASTETFICELSSFKNSLVYNYKYRDLNDVTSEQKETLIKTLETNRAAAENAVDIIKSECPQVESVFYTYYETDGDVIATMEVE